MAKINLSGIQTTTPARPRTPAGFALSPQQEEIVAHVENPRAGNLIAEARAGTGKTHTLVEVSKVLTGGAAFLAFNKAIASEIQGRLAAAGISDKEVRGQTFHSVGFAAWARHSPPAAKNVRGEKLSLLADKIGMPRSYHAFAKKAVSLAKQSLIGALPEYPIDDDENWLSLVEHFDLRDQIPDSDFNIDEDEWIGTALAWCVKLLRSSIAESPTMIDFDDMIYMPLYSNLGFYKQQWVLIDEAQDTNRARREIAQRLLKPGGRLIAVGDRHQAIYGFTGADSDALDLIERHFGCDLLPLTVTYRCAARIVQLAQQWVPDIEARPDAPEGVTRHLPYADFLKLTPEPSDAILCRLTKPLVEVAFGYLRRHVACHVEGREIGMALITLINKFKAGSISELDTKLAEYLDRERAKLLAQHKEDKLGQLEDKVDTIRCLADTFDSSEGVYKLTDLINKLFKDEEGAARQTITLSTIHKAKGREWDRVYLLGRNTLMPSKFAKQEWQLTQERNLCYVAVTRAKSELIDVDLMEKGRR